MARRQQRGADNRFGGRKAKRPGHEKYGLDPADEALKLHEDDASEASEDDGEPEEEEVLGRADEDDDDEGEEEEPTPGPRRRKDADDSGERADASEPLTKGWKGNEFYGGDDAGDESDAGSDEALVLEEARRLEEQRARRLQGTGDAYASLLVPTEEKTSSAKAKVRFDGVAAKSAGPARLAGAQFDAVFGMEAEAEAGKRDISQLSDEKRRGVMKKEAPELLPLLADFKDKLASLRTLLPLLAPSALKRLPTSGARYLEAKAALLLNTLANLSFYLLLRAEGGAVRSHPVVSQLVWLRQLHETVAPLDTTLGPKLRKALGAVKKAALDDVTAAAEDGNGAEASDSGDDDGGINGRSAAGCDVATERRRPTLRERLERLRSADRARTAELRASSTATAKARVKASSESMAASDLLRLPSRRKKGLLGNAEGAPADLEDVDPSLGLRRVGAPLGEQLTSVQQQLREKAKQLKAERFTADVNVEPRPRRARLQPAERKPSEADGSDSPDSGRPHASRQQKGKKEDDGDLEELFLKGPSKTQLKKQKRAKEQAEREEEVRRAQFHPEKEVEGRRKTSKQILANRGLVRQRKRDSGNARVTNRKKYDKLLKKRRSQVQEMREGAVDGATYEGEATGLRANLKKSQKLG